MSDKNNYNDDYEEDEDYITCALCGCTIGDEVGFGEEIAPGEYWCANCLEREGE